MKLVIVVGTRPEIIRLSETIKLSKKYFDTVLIHTGQNYDKKLNEIFFRELDLPDPNYYLDCSKENIGSAVGDIITKSYNVLKEIGPDAMLILGDTNSCLCAYSAKRLKIPIFHVEAGNRCFDPNVPEEINRKIIDHISDVNMCYMEQARQNLIKEGISMQYTFVIGSPMFEILNKNSSKIEDSKILEELKIVKREYFVLSVHREENVSINIMNIIKCIKKIDEEYGYKIIFSVHPRTRKILNEKGITFSENIVLSEPLGFIDYCKLQKNAKCVISDSGTITEESTILKFPAVLIRNSTEHPEGIDAGNIQMGDIYWNNFKVNLEIAINKNSWIDIYRDDNVSQKICSIISGYTGIVNKFVWMKHNDLTVNI